MVAWALSCQGPGDHCTLHSCTGRLMSRQVLPGPSYSLVPTCPATRWTILQGGQFQPGNQEEVEFAIHEPGRERGSVCRGEAERRLRRGPEERLRRRGCPFGVKAT